MNPLISLGTKLPRLPRLLELVRHLEVFDGPILSEKRAVGAGALYLEKWCARDATTERTLLVRTEARAVAEYMARRMSLLDLLTKPSDGVGFILDTAGGTLVAIYMVELTTLPPRYLPQPTAMHDEGLRPNWTTAPQNFLLGEDWDGSVIAEVERLYLDVFAFNFFAAEQEGDRRVPRRVLQYHYDGGFPVMHAFRQMREAVPPTSRARATGINVNSPGVLTIDAPADVADVVVTALRVVAEERTTKAYDNVHVWSRIAPDLPDLVPDSALGDLKRMCEILGLDVMRLMPRTASVDDLEKEDLLAAGKLVASYFRKLLKLLRPRHGVEFLGAAGTVLDFDTLGEIADGEDDVR
jgi:hypothetical protein